MIKPKYIIFTLSILFGHILIAQDIDIEIPDSLFIIDQEVTDEIIDPIEQQPRFPGGQDSLWCFLETQFDKSIIDQYDSSKVIVLLYFIDTLGNIQDIQANPIKLTENINHLDFVEDAQVINEIIRAFRNLPQWEPASLRERKFKYQFMQLIRFPYKYKCEL